MLREDRQAVEKLKLDPVVRCLQKKSQLIFTSSKFKFPRPSFENDSQILSLKLKIEKFRKLSFPFAESYGFSESSGSLIIFSFGIRILELSGVVISSGIISGDKFLNFLKTLRKVYNSSFSSSFFTSHSL